MRKFFYKPHVTQQERPGMNFLQPLSGRGRVRIIGERYHLVSFVDPGLAAKESGEYVHISVLMRGAAINGLASALAKNAARSAQRSIRVSASRNDPSAPRNPSFSWSRTCCSRGVGWWGAG